MCQVDFTNHPLSNIVNDIVTKKLNNIDNDNVDRIADKLVTSLNNPDAREFYCKVGWRLAEGRIWYNLESALRGKQPQKLFSWLCTRDMNKD